MTAEVAVRSMRQRKVGLLGKTAKPQGKSAEEKSSSRSASLRLQIGHKCAGGGRGAFETTQPSASGPSFGQNRERGARTLASQLEWGHENRIKRHRGAAASGAVRHGSA